MALASVSIAGSRHLALLSNDLDCRLTVAFAESLGLIEASLLGWIYLKDNSSDGVLKILSLKCIALSRFIAAPFDGQPRQDGAPNGEAVAPNPDRSSDTSFS